MFQKLRNRVNSALGGDETKVQTLQSMGFDPAQARTALQSTDGDVERAAELLLASSPAAMTAAAPSHDDELQRAMQASLQAEEERRIREAQAASTGTTTTRPTNNGTTTRTAAMNRAGEAAARRAVESQNKFGTGKARKSKPSTNKPTSSIAKPFAAPAPRSNSGGLSTHHPGVKVPAKLQDKAKEEQVLRCADRLKSYPLAVDTLHRALVRLRDEPSNDKYRKIDRQSAGYKRTLEGAPGAEGLLLAMNFQARGKSHYVLDRHLVDTALLCLGISALEEVRGREEYQQAKRKLDFAKEIKNIQVSSDSSEMEAIQRAQYMAKCPSEPTGGRGALMQVLIADVTVRRRFDGDDVLQDVLNWIGGHGSVIPDKILCREWCLVDLNRYPLTPIDCTNNLDKTLQYVGFWPSGRLEILPSTEEWKTGDTDSDMQMGSSRGLGSAPTEVLR